jgi:acyl transferase domain-containing protein
MRKDRNNRQNILEALGNVYLSGVEIDWHGVFGGNPQRKIVLPGYPFERERYWIDDMSIQANGANGTKAAGHPLLGTRIDSPLNAILFQSKFDCERTPALFDHVVHGVVIVPAAAIIEMAIAAGCEFFGSDEFDLLDISISEALTLQDEGETEVTLVLTPESNSQVAFQLYSRAAPGLSNVWRTHSSGLLVSTGRVQTGTHVHADAMVDVAARCTTRVDIEMLYRGMWDRGLQFGTTFRGLRRLSHGDGEALGEVAVGNSANSSSYRFDPAVLDACIQVVSAALPGFDVNDAKSDIFMPIAIDRVRMASIKSPPATSHARLHNDAPQSGQTLSEPHIIYCLLN